MQAHIDDLDPRGKNDTKNKTYIIDDMIRYQRSSMRNDYMMWCYVSIEIKRRWLDSMLVYHYTIQASQSRMKIRLTH